MHQHDDADLAAIAVLQALVEQRGIEFVSSRGVSTMAPPTASFLLRREKDPERSAAFAAWLLDHVEVIDLYLDDEQLEQLLRETWDARSHREQPQAEARRVDLEVLLCSEPDNLDHRLVYGDWLQSHRDPLGELITRQYAAASEPDKPALEQAAAEYLREHRGALFGPLAEYLDSVVRVRWRGGFIEQATLGRLPHDHEPYEGAILLRWLLEHRTAMLLRELELQPIEHSRGRDQLRAMLDVVLERPRPLLRRLSVGFDEDDETDETEGTGELGELERLDELLPNLEILELRARSGFIKRLSQPKLRQLAWYMPLGLKQAAAFARFELPRLESLVLRLPHQLGIPPAVAELELPSLRSFEAPGNLDTVSWLLRTPWRAQLEHLDLLNGTLQDADVRLLAGERWPRLRHLDLSNNALTAAGTALASALAPRVVIETQREAEVDDEYYESAME